MFIILGRSVSIIHKNKKLLNFISLIYPHTHIKIIQIAVFDMFLIRCTSHHFSATPDACTITFLRCTFYMHIDFSCAIDA